MKLNQKLQQIRKEKRISQEFLAEEIGVSRQAVAKWESGQSHPEIEKLITLSDFFRISLDKLLRDDEYDEHFFRKDKEILHKHDLLEFLLRAKKTTYAGKGAFSESSRPESHDLHYNEGDLLYIDSYLGGEQFAGEEALWKNGLPFWSMNYTGRVLQENFSGDFLKEALSLVPADAPYRGPGIHANGDYVYHCEASGDFTWFKGSEEIYCKGSKVYECVFHGGKII